MTATDATSASVRPLRWWSEFELTTLSWQLENAWHAWCAGWGFDSGPVQCWNAFASADLCGTVRHWSHAGVLHSDGIWLGVTDHMPADWILRGAFEAEPANATFPVAARVAQDAWQDLQQVLAVAVHTEPIAEDCALALDRPAAHQLPWSGAVVAKLALNHGPMEALVVHLGPAVAEHVCAPPAKSGVTRTPSVVLASVAEALTHRRVALEVHLGEVEIELGMLQSLRIGDVVMLSHVLGEPTTVRWAALPGQTESPILFNGHLGRSGQRKAVEVIPHRPFKSRPN